MKASTITKEQLADELINYAANCAHPILDELIDQHDSRIASALAAFERDWNNAPCDTEGPTAEQDAELDRITDQYADAILCLIHNEER